MQQSEYVQPIDQPVQPIYIPRNNYNETVIEKNYYNNSDTWQNNYNSNRNRYRQPIKQYNININKTIVQPTPKRVYGMPLPIKTYNNNQIQNTINSSSKNSINLNKEEINPIIKSINFKKSESLNTVSKSRRSFSFSRKKSDSYQSSTSSKSRRSFSFSKSSSRTKN